MSTPLLIARTLEKELYLLSAMANRHGLITGATGTGLPMASASAPARRIRAFSAV